MCAGFRSAEEIGAESQEMVILTQDPDTGELTQEIINSVTDETGEAVQQPTDQLTEVIPQQVELTDQQLISTQIVYVCMRLALFLIRWSCHVSCIIFVLLKM